MPGQERSASSVHFVRAWIVKPVVRWLEANVCPAERYLLEAHLSPDLLEDDQAAVPVRLAVDFAERASRREGIDHLGLRVAQTLTPDDLGGLRVLMSFARNLHEYVELASRFVTSVSTNARYQLRVRGDEVHFHHTAVGTDHPVHGHLFALGVTINTFRAVAGPAWVPSAVVLPCGEAEGLADVSDAFANVRVDSEARSASFRFPPSFLTLPAPSPGGAPSMGAKTALETLDAGGFRHAARRLAECLVLDGFADVHTAADASGMSVRTFQRRLAECGLVFSDLVQEARVGLAERWLLEEGRSVADVASSLGYKDPSNFTRAFRRLNGVPPSVFMAARGGRGPRPRTSASP